MKFQEYQSKQLLKEHGLNVPCGAVCTDFNQIESTVSLLDAQKLVVKAQVHAGGRGKAGGIILADNKEQAVEGARKLFHKEIITTQTGAKGVLVRALLIEAQIDIEKEYYLSFVVDRHNQCLAMIASNRGGMDIEAVAKQTPEHLHKVLIDAETGLKREDALDVGEKMHLSEKLCQEFASIAQTLYLMTVENDGMLLEINPLVVTKQEEIVLLDAKFSIDDNAVLRQQKLAEQYDQSEDDPAEVQANENDLAYVSLDGNIGCLVNGAGLAMATLDIIELYGGKAANFLDVGGGTSKEKVEIAFNMILKNTSVSVILVNIFGGIVRCDIIADALIEACRTFNVSIPIVVRLEGSMSGKARKLLKDSELDLIATKTMSEAAQMAVAQAKRN